MSDNAKKQIDFTINYRPGRDLDGVEAEVAHLTDSEPYALASVELGNSGFERVFDPRDFPGKEKEVLDLAALIVTAGNSHEPMKAALRLAHNELMWAYEQDEYAHGASGLRIAAQECWAALRLAEGEKE